MLVTQKFLSFVFYFLVNTIFFEKTLFRLLGRTGIGKNNCNKNLHYTLYIPYFSVLDFSFLNSGAIFALGERSEFN